jgi:hypothetical protein
VSGGINFAIAYGESLSPSRSLRAFPNGLLTEIAQPCILRKTQRQNPFASGSFRIHWRAMLPLP